MKTDFQQPNVDSFHGHLSAKVQLSEFVTISEKLHDELARLSASLSSVNFPAQTYNSDPQEYVESDDDSLVVERRRRARRIVSSVSHRRHLQNPSPIGKMICLPHSDSPDLDFDAEPQTKRSKARKSPSKSRTETEQSWVNHWHAPGVSWVQQLSWLSHSAGSLDILLQDVNRILSKRFYIRLCSELCWKCNMSLPVLWIGVVN